MADNVIDFVTGVRAGIGIQMGRADSIGTKSTAITFDGMQQAAPGSVSTGKYFRSRDEQQLKETLDVGVSVSGSYMFFNASGRVGYHESKETSSIATHLILKRTAVHSPEFIINPRFTDEAVDLIRNGQDDLFDKRFGNTFVEGQIMGGAYYGTGEYILERADLKDEFSVEIDAAFNAGVARGSVAVDVQNAVESSDLNIITKLDDFKIGGLIGGQAQNLEQLEARANAWGNEVENHPVGFQAILQDYEVLDQPPGMNYYDRRAIREALNAIEIWMVELDDLMKHVRYVEDNQQFYSNVNLSRLQEIKQSIVEDKNRLFEHASSCMNKPAQCIGTAIPDVPTTHFSDFPPPSRVTGGGGGGGGDPGFHTIIMRAVQDSPGAEGSMQNRLGVSERLRHQLSLDRPREGFFTGQVRPMQGFFSYHLARH
jgi:hypothetical protein